MEFFANLTSKVLWRQMNLTVCLLALLFPIAAAAQEAGSTSIHDFVVRGLKLNSEKPLWIVVTGAGIDKVNVTVRDSFEKQDLLKNGSIFENYTDFKIDRNDQTNFRILKTERLPDQITKRPVDLQISATDKKGVPARIDQVGTSNNSKQFLSVLNSQNLGRDQVIAIPERCYAKKADAILINVYTEDNACAVLKINDEHGKPVSPVNKPEFLRLHPTVIPWRKHQNLSPGIYQARVLFWYADTFGECDMKTKNSDPDFVLYSEFQILAP